jgi:hypothetical protein
LPISWEGIQPDSIQSARWPLKNNLAWPPACWSPGMDEHESQTHRCKHHFRRIGKIFAKV